MKSPTLTVGHMDQANQSNFLGHQRNHMCTDCGHAYLSADTPSTGMDYRRLVIGGGTIVADTNAPITEVHILPHCGTELPDDLLSEVHPDHYPALARLVHDNADIGTGAIYHALTEQIFAGRTRGVAVAGFHLSRLLLDANRVEIVHQVPARPYVGGPELYSAYLDRRGHELREQALLPWLAAVNELLLEMGGTGVAYHHHTYDVYSMSPRPWDRASHAKRPAFQLVYQRPSLPEDPEVIHDRGLAALPEIRGVRDRITEYLEAKIGLDDGHGDIDYPLFLPVGPFAGTRRGDVDDTPSHIMYDLRKDILSTPERIQSWVGDGPWRLPRSRADVDDMAFSG